MSDLILDTLGASLFALLGFLQQKGKLNFRYFQQKGKTQRR